MSEALWGVIIGAFLTGAFLIGAQIFASHSQADAATAAWNRTQHAQRLAELEASCVEILRLIHQIENTVQNWQRGAVQATQAHAQINNAAKAVMDVGHAIVLRKGPTDPTAPLIGRVIDEAGAYTGLWLVNRQPPATDAQKQAQAAVVAAAAADLQAQIFKMFQEESKLSS